MNIGDNKWLKNRLATDSELSDANLRSDIAIESAKGHFTTIRSRIAIGSLIAFWIVGVSLLDRSHDQPVALTSLLSIGPVVASLALSPVSTGCSALIAILLSIPLGAGDFRFWSTQHFIDTGVVLVIGCLAIYVSLLRMRTMRLLALSEQRATRDVLTSALNRRAVFEMGNRLAGWRHDIRPPMTLMMIDVDHLKEVNDTYGHQTGDHVIAEVSMRLTNALRGGDIIGRYGGDEFLAVLIGGNRVETNSVAERILDLMVEPVTYLEGHDLGVSVSIGISELGPDETEMQPALGRADNALYISKRCGRNRFTREDPFEL